MRRIPAGFMLIALAALAAPVARAQDHIPALAPLCAATPAAPAPDWRISSGLRPEFWSTRLLCRDAALRIAVHPGDAYDATPGDAPTERVEIQLRRELVRFDRPAWYGFRFRLVAPWGGHGNRTVIHQIKQNIRHGQEQPAGPCPAANPLFKIEAVGTPSGPVLLAKTRGTDDCRDGRSAVTFCGPWPLAEETWHSVQVALRPSLDPAAARLRLRVDGRDCPPFAGRLGYADAGAQHPDGTPFIDVQPRFGIYRDALPDHVQRIDFADIRLWTSAPPPDAAWPRLDD